MFDPKQLTASVLGYAPQFVLSRFSSVIMGVIVAYGVLLTFLGQPSFFQRMGELAVVMTAAYWTARGVRVGIVRVVALVEGSEVAAAAAGGGGAASGGASPAPLQGGAASPTGSPTQKNSSAAAAKGARNLD